MTGIKDQQHWSRAMRDLVVGSTPTPPGQSHQPGRLSPLSQAGTRGTPQRWWKPSGRQECAPAGGSPQAPGAVGAGSGLPPAPAAAWAPANKTKPSRECIRGQAAGKRFAEPFNQQGKEEGTRGHPNPASSSGKGGSGLARGRQGRIAPAASLLRPESDTGTSLPPRSSSKTLLIRPGGHWGDIPLHYKPSEPHQFARDKSPGPSVPTVTHLQARGPPPRQRAEQARGSPLVQAGARPLRAASAQRSRPAAPSSPARRASPPRGAGATSWEITGLVNGGNGADVTGCDWEAVSSSCTTF